MKTIRGKRRGFTLILYSVMLTFIVAAAGLALDVGTIYMIRARLSSATDAAALAAGRSVNLANTVAQATSAAQSTANSFFAANFPTGYFNTVGAPTVTPTFTQETDSYGNPTGVLDITVTASVKAPTYFMNIFHVPNVTVSASSTASRRGLVMMLVLDESSSMNTPTSPTACAVMRQAAQNFITMFSPFDYIGLVAFDSTAHLSYPPSTSWGDGSLNTAIGNIVCRNNTNTISALYLAYQQIKQVGQPLAENTIVLFTDGSPNGVSASFPLRTQSDTRWSGLYSGTQKAGGTGEADTNHWTSLPSGCQDQGPVDPYLSSIGYSINEEQPCTPPVICTSGTITGTITQWGDQDSWGATTWGLAAPTDADTAPSWPPTCNKGNVKSSNLPSPDQYNMRHIIAYIPDTDMYGNSLHGIAVPTGTSPEGTVTNAADGTRRDTRDYWLFQTNNYCNSNVSPSCKNVGDLWSRHSGVGSGSNFFTSGPYAGHFRPDQPNSIVAASMNGTMDMANTIRSDTTYHPVIHVIYLTGNGTDSVDHEFLPIVANFPNIPVLPYDAAYVVGADTQPVLYANPAFNPNQESGKYFVTADKNQLTSLFAQLASEVLRLSK